MSDISRRLALKSILLGLPVAGACGWRRSPAGQGRPPTPFFRHPLDSLDSLDLHASRAEIVRVGEGSTLSLNGLVTLPSLELAAGSIEVDIKAGEGSCYPGVVFRLLDTDNFELAYGVPQASGQPDAVQYDPVFNGSNTWQIYCGPSYQRSALVPREDWFTLRVDFQGRRAAVQVDDQAPLIVLPLAHGDAPGRVGLWTYGQAFFRDFRVSESRIGGFLDGSPAAPTPGAVLQWELPGVGTLTAEANGVLNLNRYLRPSEEPVTVLHRLDLPTARDVELGLGFSDQLALRLNGEVIFQGQNEFSGFESLGTRGWIDPERESVRCHLDAGANELAATVTMTEPFGWGMAVTVTPTGSDMHPPPPVVRVLPDPPPFAPNG
jgi:hypothetical protein